MLSLKLCMDFKVVNEISQLFYRMNSLTRNILCLFTAGWRSRGTLYAMFSLTIETSTTTDYLYREDEISQVYHYKCNQKRKRKIDTEYFAGRTSK